jgi:cytosine/adenosine deaminase-related metal-dependent hydrolase
VNNLSAAITLADNENVDTVLIAGRVVKQGGRIAGHDLRALRERARHSRDRLLESWSGPGATAARPRA